MMLNDLKCPEMALNDLKQSKMTKNDIMKMTYVNKMTKNDLNDLYERIDMNNQNLTEND